MDCWAREGVDCSPVTRAHSAFYTSLALHSAKKDSFTSTACGCLGRGYRAADRKGSREPHSLGVLSTVLQASVGAEPQRLGHPRQPT